jgi:hypothetical protein
MKLGKQFDSHAVLDFLDQLHREYPTNKSDFTVMRGSESLYHSPDYERQKEPVSLT